jgi:hypothetical protein
VTFAAWGNLQSLRHADKKPFLASDKENLEAFGRG